MTKSIKLSTILSTGKLWEKGEHSRIYLDRFEVAKALGFEWACYKTGNIKRAAYDGEKISNSEMSRVLGMIDGTYFDKKAGKLAAARFFLELLEKHDIELVDDVTTEPEPAAEAVEAEEEVEEEAATEAEEKAPSTHGGRREGAGRKPLGRIQTRLQLTPEEAGLIKQLGGSAFIRTLLEKIKAKELAIPVDTTRFTDEQKDRFIDGWTDAGGDTDDSESDTPWFAPWEWQPEIVVRGTTPEEWGADFYAQCKDEIEAIRAADEAADEE